MGNGLAPGERVIWGYEPPHMGSRVSGCSTACAGGGKHSPPTPFPPDQAENSFSHPLFTGEASIKVTEERVCGM